MEKKVVRSGAPYVLAGVGVLFCALTLGLGSKASYLIAVLVGGIGWYKGKRWFPDRVVEVERAPKSGNAEVDELIAEARAQLDAIARTNRAIAEPALSAQIEDIERTGRQILLRLEEQPNMLSTLRTFLRYYLPTTQKLLLERAKLEHEVQNQAEIAQRIRTAMAQVQTAMHKQLDALNAYRFINLESEMDVLADMLKSDGLVAEEPGTKASEQTGDPFEGLF